MGITHSKNWKKFSPYIKIQKYVREGGGSKNPRFRIEISNKTPADIVTLMLEEEVNCVACGGLIHPFRQRQKFNPKTKQRGKPGALYYACACPMNESIGCSRGDKAKEEYKLIAETLKH